MIVAKDYRPMRIYSFEPVVDKNCKLLILGTMPGVMSLKKQQYYGFQRNAFWRIVYNLFDDEPNEDYRMRKEFLLRHGIALWDVLKACEREGSSDSDIRNPEPNDFEGFYKMYPSIRHVCFNGGPAARLYQRYVGKKGTAAGVHMSGRGTAGSGTAGSGTAEKGTGKNMSGAVMANTDMMDMNITFYHLPSTSPAYTIPFEKKLEQWQLVRKLSKSIK